MGSPTRSVEGNRRYRYYRASRRRSIRRQVRRIRLLLGGVTAVVAGVALASAVGELPHGTPFSRGLLWLVADIVAVAIVVIVVSVVGSLVEWRVMSSLELDPRIPEAEDGGAPRAGR